MKLSRDSRQAVTILELLKRGETVRYVSPYGIWDFTSKKLPEPEQKEIKHIWCDESLTDEEIQKLRERFSKPAKLEYPRKRK